MTDFHKGLDKCPHCGATLTKHGGHVISKNYELKDADGKPTTIKADSFKVCHNCGQF
jgi:uncharacterized protein with PIN domain